jgi:predicted dehydrogenase
LLLEGEMSSVKVAVIGAGKFGEVHLKVFKQLELSGTAELVAFATVKQEEIDRCEKVYGVKGFLDYREMLDSVETDAVTVVTPDFLHREIAVYAASCGKHVLVEKPLDVTVEGCTEIIEAAQRNNVLLQVDFHKRYDPDHIALETAVREGRLGEILYGSCYMEDRIEVPVDWLPHWAPHGSPVWFLGSHFIDLVRWIIKSDGELVYATGSKKKLLGEFGIDMYDSVSFKVVFKNGASFSFDVSWILPREFESIVNQGLRIVGTKGLWEVDTQYRGTRSCTEAEGMRSWNNNFLREEKDKQGRTIYKGYGVDSIVDFAHNIQFLKNGGSLDDLAGKYPSGYDGREVTRICEGIIKSLETGELVRL